MPAHVEVARPPAAVPPWVNPARVAQLALILGAALWGHVTFLAPMGRGKATAGVEFELLSLRALPSTLLIGIALARRLLRPDRRRSTIGESTLAGGLNGIILFTIALVTVDGGRLSRDLWLAVPFGVWGCVWGGLYGLPFSAVIATTRAVRARPCHDATARVLRVAGACLMGVGALSLYLARAWPFLIPGGLVVLAGLGCSTLAAVHYLRTARWLEDVYEGRASEWSIVGAQGLTMAELPPPLLSGESMLLDGLLVHQPWDERLPYREAGGAPVARCTRERGAGLALLRRRATMTVLWAAGQAVAVIQLLAYR